MGEGDGEVLDVGLLCGFSGTVLGGVASGNPSSVGNLIFPSGTLVVEEGAGTFFVFTICFSTSAISFSSFD